jgi:hypothetical protein
MHVVDRGQKLRWYPRTVVLDRDPRRTAGRLEGDRQAAAFRHRFERIDQDVQHPLLEPVGLADEKNRLVGQR